MIMVFFYCGKEGERTLTVAHNNLFKQYFTGRFITANRVEWTKPGSAFIMRNKEYCVIIVCGWKNSSWQSARPRKNAEFTTKYMKVLQLHDKYIDTF